MIRSSARTMAAAAVWILAAALMAQQAPRVARSPTSSVIVLGCPSPQGQRPFNPISPNVKVYGAVYAAESCSYDAERSLIVVPNRGVSQDCRQTTAGCRCSTTTARCTRHAGSASRIPVTSVITAHAAARPQPALWERHRERRALRRRSRRRHRPERPAAFRSSAGSTCRPARPAGALRVEQSNGFNDVAVARRHHLRDADR